MKSSKWILAFVSFGVLHAAAIACRPAPSGASDSSSYDYRYMPQYYVISQKPDPEKGYIFEAQMKISPSLGKSWRLEFDYPYEVTEVRFAERVSGAKGHYVLTSTAERDDEDPSTSADTVIVIVGYGKDPGKTAPTNLDVSLDGGPGRQSTGTGTTTATSTQQTPPASTSVTPTAGGSACLPAGYGLSKDPVPASRSSYPATNASLSGLPPLSLTAKPSELKVFVAQVYDLYPVLKQIYEDDLKLTRQQVLAFMYADMSRESASNNATSGVLEWNISLETAMTPPNNSAHAWGPFQAAVTNFKGGGFDSEIINNTGLPTPDMKDFKDPAISTYAGVKRLAEGVLMAIKEFGPNKEASLYLLGSLAHHNTGWCNAAREEKWREGYGNEVLRLLSGYELGENMTNDRVFYTGEPDELVCKPL